MSHEERRPADMEISEVLAEYDMDVCQRKATTGKAPKKRYGIEHFSRWFNSWHNRTWYATERARDQAFENLETKTDMLPNTMSGEVRKINR